MGFLDDILTVLFIGLGRQILNFISGNALLMLLFCGSFVGLGSYSIKKVKSVCRK